jgi:hypothetical protein
MRRGVAERRVCEEMVERARIARSKSRKQANGRLLSCERWSAKASVHVKE